MGTDTLLSARKIRQPIASEGDIGSAFDDITYNKGAAVIRMFENYVGPEQFRKGIQNYIRKHQWGNATANDFMRAISEASGKNVTAAFSTFLDRTGVGHRGAGASAASRIEGLACGVLASACVLRVRGKRQDFAAVQHDRRSEGYGGAAIGERMPGVAER
jgi:hypothetical protein